MKWIFNHEICAKTRIQAYQLSNIFSGVTPPTPSSGRGTPTPRPPQTLAPLGPYSWICHCTRSRSYRIYMHNFRNLICFRSYYFIFEKLRVKNCMQSFLHRSNGVEQSDVMMQCVRPNVRDGKSVLTPRNNDLDYTKVPRRTKYW